MKEKESAWAKVDYYKWQPSVTAIFFHNCTTKKR